MNLSYDPGPQPRGRPLTALVLAAAAACLLLLPAAGALAQAQPGDAGPDVQVYLDQLQPVLADAQSSLDDLQYYLPVASVSDPNDPTWGLAQQASDTIEGDAEEIEILSPPDALTPANDGLIDALKSAATSANEAIDALSSGDTATGQAQLTALRAAVGALAQAEAGLPAGFDQSAPSLP